MQEMQKLEEIRKASATSAKANTVSAVSNTVTAVNSHKIRKGLKKVYGKKAFK